MAPTFGLLHALLLDHEARAALLAVGRAFLGGLEDELHRSGDALAHAREHLGRPHEDRGMGARGPQACITPHCWPDHSVVTLLANGTSTFFLHRQRVHVGAHRDDRAPGARPSAGRRRPCAHLFLHLDAERAQVVRDDLRGAELAVAELRVLMEVAAPGDDLGLDTIGGGGERGSRGNGESGAFMTGSLRSERESGGDGDRVRTRLH
jgi:hypothetical protein